MFLLNGKDLTYVCRTFDFVVVPDFARDIGVKLLPYFLQKENPNKVSKSQQPLPP